MERQNILQRASPTDSIVFLTRKLAGWLPCERPKQWGIERQLGMGAEHWGSARTHYASLCTIGLLRHARVGLIPTRATSHHA